MTKPFLPVFTRLALYIQVNKEEECWPWIGAKDKLGYGKLNVNGKYLRAHALAYQRAKGAIPDGQEIMHLCNNPNCCNPNHLAAGSRSENMQYMVASGRACRKGFPNTSGVVGVSSKLKKGKRIWFSRASKNGERFSLYEGRDFFEACCARLSWESMSRGGLLE